MNQAPATDPIRILDHPDAIAISGQIIAAARRSLRVTSLDLESWLFDHEDILAAMQALATAGREVAIRILLHDAAAPQASHSRLLALAQRLPSAFEFREIDEPAYREDRSAMVVNDGGGYLFRAVGDVVAGSAGLQSPARVRQLSARFDEVWERSRPVSEYRALGI